MSDERQPEGYREGKRAGAHPAVVVFGIIAVVWFLMYISIPSGKQKTGTAAPEKLVAQEEPDAAPVMFKVHSTVPELNVISVTVPQQATDSQVIGLLKRFHEARLSNTLSHMLPPTTPGHKLGDFANADIYIFSESQYAQPEAVSVLARGAHAPGDLYPRAVQFEVAMEHVRGHYRIDMADGGAPDKASLGFADETGVHSANFRRLF